MFMSSTSTKVNYMHVQVWMKPASDMITDTSHFTNMYHNLPIKRPWRLKFTAKKRGWAFTRRSRITHIHTDHRIIKKRGWALTRRWALTRENTVHVHMHVHVLVMAPALRDGPGVFTMKGTPTMHAYSVNVTNAKVHNHNFVHAVNPLPLVAFKCKSNHCGEYGSWLFNKPIHVHVCCPLSSKGTDSTGSQHCTHILRDMFLVEVVRVFLGSNDPSN